jgi:hypothetical protein
MKRFSRFAAEPAKAMTHPAETAGVASGRFWRIT